MNRLRKNNMKNKLISFLLLIGNAYYTQTYYEVRDYIYDSTDIKHKDIVLKQTILETAWFNCKKCSMEKNNLFGWYYKKQYLIFTHWKESILYYERWQNRHYVGGDYYNFLECGRKHSDGTCMPYATEPDYINRLKNINLKD